MKPIQTKTHMFLLLTIQNIAGLLGESQDIKKRRKIERMIGTIVTIVKTTKIWMIMRTGRI